MIFFLVLGLAFAVLIPPGISAGRVIGGTDAKIEDFPYVVPLYENVSGELYHNCGGSIISDKVVLTAAHCFNPNNEGEFVIRYGSANITDGGKLISVHHTLRHEGYNLSNYAINDIGLLFLNEPIQFSPTASPIKLPTSTETVPIGEMLTLTGWGYTNLENGPGNLTKNVCKELAININRTIHPGWMCVGFIGSEGKGACYGDSGSPLVWNGTQYGVVSDGLLPCAKGYPDIYTDVAYYREWIDSQIIEYEKYE